MFSVYGITYEIGYNNMKEYCNLWSEGEYPNRHLHLICCSYPNHFVCVLNDGMSLDNIHQPSGMVTFPDVNHKASMLLGSRSHRCHSPMLMNFIPGSIVDLVVVLGTMMSHQFVHCLNSSPPSDAYMRQGIGSALVHVVACRPFGAKPLSMPMLNHFYLNKLQSNFNQNTKCFIHENASENIVCETTAILSMGRWVNSLGAETIIAMHNLSVSWLLIAWFFASICHQQTWFWLWLWKMQIHYIYIYIYIYIYPRISLLRYGALGTQWSDGERHW